MDAGAVRRRNLSAVLELVHLRRGVTRADLTRALGLNRSTIGDLVAVLAEQGWVDERDDAPRSGVGRPSPRVVPREDRLVAAINPELDVVDVALVALGGKLVARQRISLAERPSADDAVRLAAGAIAALMAHLPSSTVVAGGIAVPGLVRRSDGHVRLAPHLGWHDEPIAARLSLALGVPAHASNDAHLGCRAELAFGAGVGAGDVIYLNGGPSGIGGGIVMGGRAVDGVAGYAGEVGHLCVDPGGPICACGARGCLETLVKREFLMAALGLVNADDDEFESALLAASLAELNGGPVHDEIKRQLHWLSIALRGVVNLFNPQLVILGGHLAAVWLAAASVDRDTALADALKVSGQEVRIEVAALGAHRLLVGAAELAWDGLIMNPLGTD